MVLRELSESEWQHSFVPVLALAGSANRLGSAPGGGGDRAREHAVGDVKHIMDKTIGRRCCRISGAVSAANYLEVPREARIAPLNLTGRFVYIQVRPIGDKVMTFHLDVLDAGGRPERVTFSTLYSNRPSTPTRRGGGGGGGSSKRPASAGDAGGGRVSTTTTLSRNTKHGNGAASTAVASTATALEAWKSGGVGGGGAGWATTTIGEAATADAAAGTALVKRGGALRYPVSFDTSRSRGWTVVGIDMVALMLEGGGRAGAAGGREYGVLRGVKLGSNMVVRGVYASDCVYSPHTLPKEMAFRIPGGGKDWETAYNWLWLPEVPDENAAPPADGTRPTTRLAWPPGADSPTPSVAAANAADARGRRRMEKRHFFAEPGTVGRLLAHEDNDGVGGGAEEEGAVKTKGRASTPGGRGRSGAPGIRGRPTGKGRRESSGVSVGEGFPRTPRRAGGAVAVGIAALSPAALGRGGGRRGQSTPPRPVLLASPRTPYSRSRCVSPFSRFPLASPAQMRPASAAAGGSGGIRGAAASSPRARPTSGVWRARERSLMAAPSPTAAVARRQGKPPVSPTRRRVTAGGGGGRGRTFFLEDDEEDDHDDGGFDVGVDVDACGGGDVGGGGGGGGGGGKGGAKKGSAWDWTNEELEAWPGGETAPATPVVAVLNNGGERLTDGDEEEEEGRGAVRRAGASPSGVVGMDPPVLSRVLPPGLEASRPDPPEFDPDPALRLERALCYTGGDLPGSTTVTFVGRGAEFMAFPCNNVIVLMETPVMPEAVFSRDGPAGMDGGVGAEKEGEEEDEEERDGLLALPQPAPAPHIFLRGHTDTVTRLQLSHAGHLLASAQGDPLGAAGGHGIIRLWNATSLGRRSPADCGSARAAGGRRTPLREGGGGKCAAHFIAHRWGVSSMCFSSDDRLLCTVGGDDHRRTQVIVWDVALLCTARAGTIHGAGSGLAVVARQISDFPITKMLFSPFEKLRLVSCGRENVRFWRVRRRHLPACPAVLNDFARDLACTDLAFQSSCSGIAGVEDHANWAEGPRVVYVSSRAGTVLQVSYHTRNLLCVLQLHNGPILSLEVNEDHAITGSEDKVLRMWPLDFSDFLMEAAHESPVVSVCTSKDGLKLAVGTAGGSISVLDVMTHGYTTALRSHRGGVTAAAIDPSEERDDFATVSEDCTIRVWDLVSGVQRYQFSSPTDRPTCVAYAPKPPPPQPEGCGGGGGGGGAPEEEGGVEHAAAAGAGAGGDERWHLVAGYASGTVRVFDVPSTSTLLELEQHRNAVQQVTFTPDGTRLISAGEDGLLCLFDVTQGYRPSRVMACDEPQPGRPINLSVSPGSDRLAVIGTEPSCILLYDLATLALKGRLGKPGRRGGGRLVSGVGGGGGGGGPGMLQPWSHRPGSSDAAQSPGGAAAAAAASGGFLHAAFSGDGADLLACTTTKLFRFPLGGGDVHAWSALLPCKAGPAMAACNPATGPGLILVSPAEPVAGAGEPATASTASAWGGEAGCWTGGGGGKRGSAPRTLGGGGSALAPSELFLSQVHRDERNASVVISAPQAFAAHASPVTVAAFSAGGDRLVTCDGTGVVLLWSNLAAPAPEAWEAPPLPLPRRSGGEACGLAGRSGGGGLFGGDGVEAEEVKAGAAAGAPVIVDDVGHGEGGLALRVRVPAEGDVGQEEEEGFAKTAPMPVAAGSSADLVTPMGPGPRAAGTGGPGGYASMLDQTPSPTAVQNPSRSSNATAVAPAAEGRGSERAGSGPLAEAIQALQTVVDDAAAAVGEGDDGGGMIGGAVRPPRAVVEIKRHRFGGAAAEVAASVVEDCDSGRHSDSGGIEAWEDSANDDEMVASRGAGGRRAAPAAEIRPISGRASPAAERSGTAMSPLTWHPASARLFYAEGSSLYAEDLESCRRWALLSREGGGVAPASCVAVSSDGHLVARGVSSQRPGGISSGSSGVSSSWLSVWRLGPDSSMPQKPRDGDSGDANRSKATSRSATATAVDACEEVGVVGSSGGGGVSALAFSPCGADLCSLGEWDGTKCLLEVRPTSAFVAAAAAAAAADNSGSAASSSSVQSAASVAVVTPLSVKTSAICALPPRKAAAAAGEPEPFLFATGGEEGVGLWRRVFDQAAAAAGGTALRGRGGDDGDGGGVKLLGTSAGRGRVTALASAGRFVVAADVSSSSPPSSSSSSGGGGGGGGGGAAAAPFVSAIDVNWLAAGGQEAGMQGLVGDEEVTWRVFRGGGGSGGSGGNGGDSRDVAITCLASAGPCRVAVAGSGGKLEIWDVEAACAGQGGGGGGGEGFGAGQPGAGAGLVRRLDLGDALEGASVTSMTWDAGGTDAVIGCAAGEGGGIWHLRLPSPPPESSSSSSSPPRRRGGDGADREPTIARLWPGGNVKAAA